MSTFLFLLVSLGIFMPAFIKKSYLLSQKGVIKNVVEAMWLSGKSLDLGDPFFM